MGGILLRLALVLTLTAACRASQLEMRSTPPGNRLAAGEHWADLGEVRLWYRVAGRGPYVVVSSVNWGAGTAYLQHADGIAPLERDYTMIYVNSRGTPPSSRPADARRMSTSHMVDDLEALRRYLGLPTVDLLGHSGGAMIVLGYAQRYAAHARKLLLVDGALLDAFPLPRTGEIIDSRRGDPRFAQAIARSDRPKFAPTDTGFTQYLADILPLYFHDPEKNLSTFARTLTNTIDYWTYVHNEAADKRTLMRQSHELHDITAQTLIIVGRSDFVCPPEASEQIARGVNGSTLVTFEQSGHMPWIEERERFFEVVRDFLRKPVTPQVRGGLNQRCDYSLPVCLE